MYQGMLTTQTAAILVLLSPCLRHIALETSIRAILLHLDPDVDQDYGNAES